MSPLRVGSPLFVRFVQFAYKMSPLRVGLPSKRGVMLLRRIGTIAGRYGMTAGLFVDRLDRFAETLASYQSPATFPVTAVMLSRDPAPFRRLHRQGIEIAIHGNTHVDLTRLTPAEQAEAMQQAVKRFRLAGLPCAGFRAPYLRYNPATLAAAARAGLLYDSSQAILWDVVDETSLDDTGRRAWSEVVAFYAPHRATATPSLPTLVDGLVEIPVSLPDDEMLIERLGWRDVNRVAAVWLEILHQSHQRGELFVLQLHPERFDHCREALIQVLTAARAKGSAVWIASLHEIAHWWRHRASLEGAAPLWPAPARSALAITGDIDALTLWDYGLRLVGY